MKNYILKAWILVLIFTRGDISLGQKPTPIQIRSLISQIPIPENSQACYGSCTTTKDPDGMISITDNGPRFNSLNEEMERISKGDMDAMKGGYANAQAPSPSSVPTADQIAQMQAEAMQRAQQATQNGGDPARAAQSGNQQRPPTANVALMQELGKAQSSIGQINQLVNELSIKLGQLKMDDVPIGPNCPEVRQGSYVGPTCSCTREKAIDYEQRRVVARDKYLLQVSALLKQYISQIQTLVAPVDKVETDAKFGQAVSDPTTIQMLWSVQRQALGGFTSLLAMASGTWSDGAKQFLNVVNATNKTCP